MIKVFLKSSYLKVKTLIIVPHEEKSAMVCLETNIFPGLLCCSFGKFFQRKYILS